jgi:hypothetical protein
MQIESRARTSGERELNKAAFASDLERSPTSGDRSRIAILLPGIRTNGDWIDEASRHVETFSIPIYVIKAYGGRISTWQLLTRTFLGKIRREVRLQIVHTIVQNPQSEISLICHSMGSDLLVDIIEELGAFRFQFIVFLGSVCHVRNSRLIARNCHFFVNHKGTFDV